jgi:hypothetical protein
VARARTARTAVGIGLTSVVLVLAIGLANADEIEKSDPEGDTKGTPIQSSFDFRKERVKHAGNGHGTFNIITHTVVSWTRAGYKSVVLEIKSGEDPFFAYVRKKPHKKAAVYNYYTDQKIADAKYKKLSARSFSFTFDTEFMGHPDRYGWRWRVLAKDDKTYDKLPNSGLMWHNLDVH